MGKKKRVRRQIMGIQSTLGAEIAAARKRKNLSQRELAALLGVHDERTGQAQISQWESGVRRIVVTPAQKAVLAEVLGWQRSKFEAEIAKHHAERAEAILARRSAGIRKHAEQLAQQLGVVVAATKPEPAPASTPEATPAPVNPDKLLDFAIAFVPVDESMRYATHAVLRQFVLDVRRAEERLAKLL
jgi:DNA-binding transcriptional regulator YiaG